ncbi:MAG: Uma2 family endonuclease [Thermomicrobiales bacterium]
MVATVVEEASYQRVARLDPDGQWELHEGQLREKSSMSAEHNDLMAHLGLLIGVHLPRDRYRLRINAGRLRAGEAVTYIPDLAIIPTDIEATQRGRGLEVYDQPLPLVVEIRSPSTGGYDVNTKLPAYRTRGDLEIWRVHPAQRTVTVWRRRSDGTYDETVARDGALTVASVPGVTIDLATLFGE